MLARIAFAVIVVATSLRAAADLSDYADKITGVTTPALLWSNVEDAYPNREVDRIAGLSEVLETFTNGVSTGSGSDKHIVIYGLPPGVTTKAWLQHEHEDQSLFPALRGSFMLFPYTLATPGNPKDRDWAELFATVNSSAVRFLTNVMEVNDGTEILYQGIEDTWSAVRERMDDARVLVIQPNLLEGALGDLSFTANLAAFFPSNVFGNDEQVFVLAADTMSIKADALPKILNKYGGINAKVRGPMLPGPNAAIPDEESPGKSADQNPHVDEDDEIAQTEAAVAAAYHQHPAADLRRLQSVTDDGPELRITPMQVQMILVIGFVVAGVWIAVSCTGAISTPKLYLEKTIAVNKEF